jgi:hypothetical protein
MKVEKTTAYRSENESLWETEKEAIENNIDSLISEIDTFDIYTGVKAWFKKNPKSVKYILANINKINVE